MEYVTKLGIAILHPHSQIFILLSDVVPTKCFGSELNVVEKNQGDSVKMPVDNQTSLHLSGHGREM